MARNGKSHSIRHLSQSGAAAVEFALVFPILFLLVYGVIVYSYIYVLQQSITYAAQEAAEAAVSVDPQTSGYTAKVVDVVRSTAYSALSWLPSDQRARVVASPTDSSVIAEVCPAGGVSGSTGVTCPIDSDAMVVRLRFRLAQSGDNVDPLFPVIDLFMVGRVPPMPDTLTATAIVRI